MADHEHCPVQSIINAVFNGFKGVPEEIAKTVRECEKCFVFFYGAHLGEELLASPSQRSYGENFHLEHCSSCRNQQRRLLPNKMGRSHPDYISKIAF